jgi:hypothetical protein
MFRKGGVLFVPLFSQDFPGESPFFSVAVSVDKGAVEYLLPKIPYKDILLINPLPPSRDHGKFQ